MRIMLWVALILTCLLPTDSAAASPRLSERSGSEPKREKIDLPGFEQGDLFVLGRLSNDKLVNIERSEWVNVAILLREGLDLSHRKAAILRLAKLRKTDVLTQILEGITRTEKNGAEQTGALKDLIRLLLASPTEDLKKKRDALVRFATDADHALARRAGYAALILADGAVEPAWQLAEKSKEGLVDVLGAVPLISDRKALAAFSPKVEPLLHKAPSRSIRQSAILAAASIPGRESKTFTTLASFVREGTERDTAIEALERIPKNHWPKDQAQDLVMSVMKYLKGVDPTRRNTPQFQRARQLSEDLASLLPASRGKKVRAALESLGIRIVTIRSVPYAMAFDRVHIVVKAGSPIAITFENPDTRLHNLVIVAPGALAEIGVVASQMLPDSENWRGHPYVPNSNKILYATSVLRNTDSYTITLVAPEVVGEYPYLCTYPGHWVSMNGVLHVVEDVDAWIAKNPIKATGVDPDARAFVRAWRLNDIMNNLDKLDMGRSLERGKELFSVASCKTCHRNGKDGGGLIGPDMAEVSSRLKPAEMLAEIIEPSKTINEQYRTWSILLDDGRTMTGIITKQDADAIHLVKNPLASTDPIRISRDQIEAMKSSKISTMPMGMLNTLTRDEILDLLAYIRSHRAREPVANDFHKGDHVRGNAED